MPHQPVSPSLSHIPDPDQSADSEGASDQALSESPAMQGGVEGILASLQNAVAVSTSDLDTILHWIAQEAQKLTGANGVAVAVRRDEAIVCCGRSGEMAPGLGARLSVDSGFSGACLIAGKTLRCHDTFDDDRVDVEVCRSMGLRSIAAVPLRSPYGVTGLLEAFSSQPRGFADEHLGFLERLAALAEQARARSADARNVHVSPAEPSLLAVVAEPSGSVELATREPEPVALAITKRSWPHWAIASGGAGLVLLALLGWTLWQRRASPPVTAVAATKPDLHVEVATPGNTPPLALKPSASRPSTQSPPASAARPMGLQPASQIQVELGPRVVVPAGAQTATSPPAPASADEKPERAADAEPPKIAAIDGKESLGLLPGVPAMPTLGAPTSQLSQGVLVHQVQPIYPIQALPMRLEGPVVIQAVVAADGRVRNLKVVSGHPILAKAATDAVRQWRYQPFLLNGKPVPMETEITVRFKIP